MRHRSSHLAVAAAWAVLLAGCGPAAGTVTDDVVASSPATPNEVAGSPAETAAAVPPADPAAPDERAATLRGLAVGGDQVVVVGADDTVPAAWSVAGDGEWTPHTVAPGSGVPRLDAAALDGALGIAFGSDDAGGSQAWVTDDLRAWRRHDVAGIDGRVSAVTVSDARWMAVGDRVDTESGEAYEGVVWVSEDATSFDVLADGLALTEGTLSDVAAAAGTVVVVGFDVSGGVAWTSSDGGPFESGSGPFDGATIDGVTALDGQFVALGRGLADLGLRAWTSTDGRRWEAVDVTGDELEPQDEIHDLATHAGRVLAVGGTADSGRVWTFQDGALSPMEP